ncbi:MAG: hypothetical protein HY225_00710 [Candidatus Vogelbacteria bacterium]|nr:hypothetical protein [Candidatus Vogelbacteria bacterium]
MFENWWGKKINNKKSESAELTVEDLNVLWRERMSKVLVELKLEYTRPDDGLSPDYHELEKELIELAHLEQKRNETLYGKVESKIRAMAKQAKRNFLPMSLVGLLGLSLQYFGDQSQVKVKKPAAAPTAPIATFKPISNQIQLILQRSHDLPFSEKKFDFETNISIEKGGFNIDKSTIEIILTETLPKGLVENINDIIYEDKLIPILDQYNKKNVYEVAHTLRMPGQIIFSKGAVRAQPRYILGHAICHEAGHSADWLGNRRLSAEDRINLFKLVTARVQSGDRYKSVYVESITNKNKAEQVVDRSTEYFADIVAAWLSEDYGKLTQQDKNIVENVVIKIDPMFDRQKALNKRNKIIAEFDKKRLAEGTYVETDFE